MSDLSNGNDPTNTNIVESFLKLTDALDRRMAVQEAQIAVLTEIAAVLIESAPAAAQEKALERLRKGTENWQNREEFEKAFNVWEKALSKIIVPT